MKNLIAILCCGMCLILAPGVFAGDQHEAEGVVKKIKSDDKKITISHGPIKSLGMDGMTMDFAVYDPSMLGEVKEGHQVSFMVEVDKAGNFVIMEIEDEGKAKAGSMASSDDHSQHHKH